MDAPKRLTTDIDDLRSDGYCLELVEDGTRFCVIFKGFVLPPDKYCPSVTDLMVMTDYQYPMSRMDMFWTDPTVKLRGGHYPRNADQFEQYAGRRWQRWSWHYPVWDPSKHSVRTHIEVVVDRLTKGT